MPSVFIDLLRDTEKIRKSLFDQACRITKYVDRAKTSPANASSNLEKAAQCADKWQTLAKSKNVVIDTRHFQRMAEISKKLRACISINEVKRRSRTAEAAIQELRQVIKNSRK